MMILTAVLVLLCALSATNLSEAIIRVPLHKSAYGHYVNVAVGSAKQELKLLVNTASANTWLISSKCHSKACLKNTKFQAEQSSTFEADSKQWSEVSGSGIIVNGTLGTDQMTIGGLTVKRQRFGMVELINGVVAHFMDFDGVLGLGSKYAISVTFKDPIRNLYDSKLISEPKYSLYLSSRNTDPAGWLILGGVDESLFEGSIEYMPTKQRWIFDTKGVNIGESSERNFMGRKATVDSTSNVIAGRGVNNYIRSKLQLASLSPVMNVDRIGNLADAELLGINQDFNLYLKSGKYTLKTVDDVSMPYENPFDEHVSDGTLTMAFLEIQKDIWVLGQPFLKKYYTIFDFGKKQIGFALAKQPAT